MTVTTEITRRLGISHPIIQAPMASAATPAMAIAACEAGALGSIGAAYHTPDRLRDEIRAIKAATDKPFNVNLFVPDNTVLDPARLAAANDVFRPIRQALDLPDPQQPPDPPDRFADLAAIILEERVAVFSFHFGLPDRSVLDAARAAGMVLVGSATSPDDAARLEAAGMDMVVAQSNDAGGHQGTFEAVEEPPGIGTMALVPQVVDRVSIPVIAAGGIMDGRGIAAALALGAGAVQMGTAFLAAPESASHPAHKALLTGEETPLTRHTRAFSGRPARGLVNRYMRETAPHTDALLPFPFQNSYTSDIKAAATKLNLPDFLPMWAGHGAPLTQAQDTARLIETLVNDLDNVLARMKGLG